MHKIILIEFKHFYLVLWCTNVFRVIIKFCYAKDFRFKVNLTVRHKDTVVW